MSSGITMSGTSSFRREQKGEDCGLPNTVVTSMVPPLHENGVRLEGRGRSCELGLLLLASQPNLRLIKRLGKTVEISSRFSLNLSAEDEKALGQGMLFCFSRV